MYRSAATPDDKREEALKTRPQIIIITTVSSRYNLTKMIEQLQIIGIFLLTALSIIAIIELITK